MNCCQCQGIESLFDQREAERDLAEYRRDGPRRSTRALVDALLAEGVANQTLLDIGGGVGAIQYALLAAGASQATDVDAARAYLAVARAEGQRRGLADRVRYVHGNFVELASEIDGADIVTLDRVLCCYHDMPALVAASVAKTRRLYGVVFPRDTWWAAAGARLINLGMRLRRTSFRLFIHATTDVDALIEQHGLAPAFSRNVGVWQVRVYARP